MQGAVLSDFKPLTPRSIRPDPMIARDLVGYGEASLDPADSAAHSTLSNKHDATASIFVELHLPFDRDM
jgi:hypothetical protein